jgi:hypothetical protein
LVNFDVLSLLEGEKLSIAGSRHEYSSSVDYYTVELAARVSAFD